MRAEKLVEDRGRTKNRKRINTRWAPETRRLDIAGLPLLLPHPISDDQLQQYLRVLRIEEISQKLRSGDVEPPESERSPSPVAEYGPDGRRINTTEARYRKKLEDERHRLVQLASNADPYYRPPIDYRRQTRQTEKVYIPSMDFPEINFIGLLIGPRGRTLQRIEGGCGIKVSIRGKGSHKEGRGFKNIQQPQEGDDEDLHALVMGDSESKIQAGVEMINDIIEQACSIPEANNELKKQQLRELAELNGTFRETDGDSRFEFNSGTTSLDSSFSEGASGSKSIETLEKNKRLESEYESFLQSIEGDVNTGLSNDSTSVLTKIEEAPWSKSSSKEAPITRPPWMQQMNLAPNAVSYPAVYMDNSTNRAQ